MQIWAKRGLNRCLLPASYWAEENCVVQNISKCQPTEKFSHTMYEL